MVNETRRSLIQRLYDGVQHDLEGFIGRITPTKPPEPGLYTYRVELPGGQKRLHLRIEDDGTGVLFVDVTDTIHLNPTAAEMTICALDGLPPARARAALRKRFPGADQAQLTHDLTRTYEMIQRFTSADAGCPICAMASLQRAPLFSTPARAPYKVDIALTYGCNNGCTHCYNETDRLMMPSLAAAEWRRVLDTLARVGVPHIIFTGGEATLHPHLSTLIAYADSLGQIVGLNTNGRRMAHRSYVQTLVDAGLNHVQITLGSSRPAVHNAMMCAVSFEQTIQGIQNSIESGLHTITNTTLMRRNMDHTAEIISFLHGLGVRTFAMNGMIYSGGGAADPNAIPEDELAPLLIQVRDQAAALGMRFLWYTPTEYCRMSPVELEIGAKRCNAGEYTLCVEPDGSVLPCQSYYVAAGNILRDPWEQIWHSPLFHSFRDRIDQPQQTGLPEKCWHCPDLPLCGGGCRLEREAHGINANAR